MNFKDEIFTYGVVLGKRFTQKEKMKFLKAAQVSFDQMNYRTVIMKSDIDMGLKKKNSYHNLYTENISKADVIVATYYDTGIKNILKTNTYAFSHEDSQKNQKVHLALSLVLLVILIGFAYFMILPLLQNKGIVSFGGVLSAVYLLGAFAIVRKFTLGFPNKYNFVKNTSSILSLLQLASEKDCRNYAFAFLDGGQTTNHGYKMLETIANKNAIIIYLDSVGNGNEIQIFTQKQLSRSGLDRYTNENQRSYFITFGDLNDGKVVVNNGNTSNDNIIDETVLTANSEKILAKIKDLRKSS